MTEGFGMPIEFLHCGAPARCCPRNQHRYRCRGARMPQLLLLGRMHPKLILWGHQEGPCHLRDSNLLLPQQRKSCAIWKIARALIRLLSKPIQVEGCWDVPITPPGTHAPPIYPQGTPGGTMPPEGLKPPEEQRLQPLLPQQRNPAQYGKCSANVMPKL